MFNPIGYIKGEMDKVKPWEAKQLAVMGIAMLVILWMALFSSEDRTLGSEISFDPKVPGTHWILPLDLDRLSHAVAVAETGNCRKGTARLNNCHGIMSWKGGKRHPARFGSVWESHAEFKRIWAEHYGRFPTLEDAERWTGRDGAASWLSAVTGAY